MNELNNAQQSAAQTSSRHVAIIAGPGTGKTKTLVARIQFLLKNQTKPEKILALTFTKKSAQEMRQRLGHERVKVSTFHGLCFDILQHDRDFVSEVRRLQIIKNLQKPGNLKNLSTRDLGLMISKAKNDPQMLDDSIRQLVDDYNLALNQENLSDFDDLLINALQLLKNDPTKLAELHAQLSHILVDEFQDTNNLQYELLKLISGAACSVFVIGDPLQSIYGFRGASGDIFKKFLKEFSNAQHITLNQNYRSSNEVVGLANAVFGGNLVAASNTRGRVDCIETLNEFSEAKLVLNEIEQAIGGSDLQRAVSNDIGFRRNSLKDFAVIYRNRSASNALRTLLEASGLPYQIVGEGSPYENTDVLSLIEALKNSNQLNSNPVNFVAQVIIERKLQQSDAIKQLLATLSRFKITKQALAYFEQISQNQFYDDKAELITLLTIHAAKGLEFNRVFLIACEQGTLPHDKGEQDEEKRLFYVALTRAKQSLSIIYTQRRMSCTATLSQFVESIPRTILPRKTDANLFSDKIRAQKRSAKRAQATLF